MGETNLGLRNIPKREKVLHLISMWYSLGSLLDYNITNVDLNFLVQTLVQNYYSRSKDINHNILFLYCSWALFSDYYVFLFCMFAWVFSSTLYMFSKSLDVCTLYRYLYFFHISYKAKEDILMVREWEVFSNNVLLMYVCMYAVWNTVFGQCWGRTSLSSFN